MKTTDVTNPYVKSSAIILKIAGTGGMEHIVFIFTLNTLEKMSPLLIALEYYNFPLKKSYNDKEAHSLGFIFPLYAYSLRILKIRYPLVPVCPFYNDVLSLLPRLPYPLWKLISPMHTFPL